MRVPAVNWTAVSDDPVYHPGRCAELRLGETMLGRVGQVHPLTAKNFDLEGAVYAAELDLEALFAAMGPERTYIPLPRFPAVTRDIAVVCDEAVTAQELQTVISSAGGKKLVDSRLFDVYTGAPSRPGRRAWLSHSSTARKTERSPMRTRTERRRRFWRLWRRSVGL